MKLEELLRSAIEDFSARTNPRPKTIDAHNFLAKQIWEVIQQTVSQAKGEEGRYLTLTELSNIVSNALAVYTHRLIHEYEMRITSPGHSDPDASKLQADVLAAALGREEITLKDGRPIPDGRAVRGVSPFEADIAELVEWERRRNRPDQGEGFKICHADRKLTVQHHIFYA